MRTYNKIAINHVKKKSKIHQWFLCILYLEVPTKSFKYKSFILYTYFIILKL